MEGGGGERTDGLEEGEKGSTSVLGDDPSIDMVDEGRPVGVGVARGASFGGSSDWDLDHAEKMREDNAQLALPVAACQRSENVLPALVYEGVVRLSDRAQLGEPSAGGLVERQKSNDVALRSFAGEIVSAQRGHEGGSICDSRYRCERPVEARGGSSAYGAGQRKSTEAELTWFPPV